MNDIKLDYSIQSPEERKKQVEIFLQETPNPSPYYLEILADYLVFPKDKEIITNNRLVTINKRETSFEGLSSRFEDEDTIYNLITEDKNQIFYNKTKITEEDYQTIPFLSQIRDAISFWKSKHYAGKQAYTTIQELYKDIYLVYEAYKKPVHTNQGPVSPSYPSLDSVEHPNLTYSGVSLFDKKICSLILCNYAKLKEQGDGNFNSDTWYLMETFDGLAKLPPPLELIATLKIEKKSNAEIVAALEETFGYTYTPEYISSLWRNKIPRLISENAKDQYLNWYYLTQKKGHYKKCGRCGQIKLALPRYFSKNTSSRDGLYSICKECRKKKNA